MSLLQTGGFPTAALYAFGSLILGLAAVWCGMLAAEFLS
jgi:fluoride ion exporter CrcB/FEX